MSVGYCASIDARIQIEHFQLDRLQLNFGQFRWRHGWTRTITGMRKFQIDWVSPMATCVGRWSTSVVDGIGGARDRFKSVQRSGVSEQSRGHTLRPFGRQRSTGPVIPSLGFIALRPSQPTHQPQAQRVGKGGGGLCGAVAMATPTVLPPPPAPVPLLSRKREKQTKKRLPLPFSPFGTPCSSIEEEHQQRQHRPWAIFNSAADSTERAGSAGGGGGGHRQQFRACERCLLVRAVHPKPEAAAPRAIPL